MNPLLLVDSYKIHHTKMYPDNMTLLYSNFTPRKSRIEGINEVLVFGIQHFIKEYFIKVFNKEFFLNKERNHGAILLMNNTRKEEYLNALKSSIIEEYR